MTDNACDKIRYGNTVYGGACYVDRRTGAHLDKTKAALPSGASLLMMQGCFNTSVAASAGTHDKAACVDVKINGMTWSAAQKFLRQQGWAAWHRTPAQGFSAEHIHMISLGYAPCQVGEFVDGGVSISGRKYTSSQVDDYYHHSIGLKGQHNTGADTSWFPVNIAATIFNYDEWIDNMPLSDEDIQKIADAVWKKKFAAVDNLSAGIILKNIARILGVAR